MPDEAENSPSVAASHARIHIMMGAVVAIGVIGGWLYAYATQTADAKTTAERVVRLEVRDDVNARLLSDMNARVVRIETMVGILLEKKKELR